MNTYYLLGKAAFTDGKSRDANPYNRDTESLKYWDWIIGYRYAESMEFDA